MKDYRDLSRLPDEPDYWDALEARILADLGPQVRTIGSGTFVPIALRAASLALLATAAAVFALLFAPPREQAVPTLEIGLVEVPADDPAMVEFMTSASPPPIGSLLLPQTQRSGR